MPVKVEYAPGKIIEFPDGTPPETMTNFAERAHNISRAGHTGYERPGWLEAIDQPDWLKRGMVGAVGGVADLIPNALNLFAKPYIESKTGVEEPPLPLLTPNLMRWTGVRPQDENTSTASKVAEGAATLAVNPVSGTRNLATAAIPYAERGARAGSTLIDNLMTRLFPNQAGNLAQRASANAVGTVASSAGGVAGEAIGQEMGGEQGAFLGSLFGGGAPSAFNNLPVRGTLRTLLPGDPNAIQQLDIAGVTPMMGLTSSPGAARFENVFAGVPGVGQVVRQRQQTNFEQFQDRVNQGLIAAGRVPGPDEGLTVQSERLPGTVPPNFTNEDVLGNRLNDAAVLAQEGFTERKNDLYARANEGLTNETLVDPVQTRATARQLQQRTGPTARDVTGRENAAEVIREQVDPNVVTRGSYSEYEPPVIESGIPLDVAKRAASRMGERQRAEGTPMDAADLGRIRTALNVDDRAEAIRNSPELRAQYPDPQARALRAEDLNERHRLADFELNREMARSGVSSIAPPVVYDPVTGQATTNDRAGGGYRALEKITGADTDVGHFRAAQIPDRMAALDRGLSYSSDPRAQGLYPTLAGDVIAAKSVSNQSPYPDIQISPEKFTSYWSGLGEDPTGYSARDVMTSGRPEARAILDNAEQVGQRFRQRKKLEETPGTAPTLATIGGLTAFIKDPPLALAGLASLVGGAHGVSSDTAARYLSRQTPEGIQMILRRLADSGVLASAQAGMRLDMDQIEQELLNIGSADTTINAVRGGR